MSGNLGGQQIREVVVEGVRTANGRMGGSLANMRAEELAVKKNLRRGPIYPQPD
jgi:hypothetical protein